MDREMYKSFSEMMRMSTFQMIIGAAILIAISTSNIDLSQVLRKKEVRS